MSQSLLYQIFMKGVSNNARRLKDGIKKGFECPVGMKGYNI